jgi:hypothetical protein
MLFFLLIELSKRNCPLHTIQKGKVSLLHLRKKPPKLAVAGMWIRKVLIQSAFPFSINTALTWAIEQGKIFVWVWTILQWNLMARSISIDPLALHNILICEDHFVICHDSRKSDKEGAKIHNKAVYCNPLDPILCPGVSLESFGC